MNNADTNQKQLSNKEPNASHSLKAGNIGWLTLAALGVSFVIAGEFAAWNYGLSISGFGGMIVALITMAVMYFCIVFSIAELAAIISDSGGGFGFAKRAFGPFWGYLTGLAVVFEYVLASSAIALFFQAYFSTLFGDMGIGIIIALYSVFILIHMMGVAESMKVLLVLAGITLVGIIVFLIAMLPYFDVANLYNGSTDKVGGMSSFLPDSVESVWLALPFAMAMFLAVEGVPLSTEEVKDPQKNVPKGMIVAMIILFLLAISILAIATGGAGVDALSKGDSPLIYSLNSVGITSGAIVVIVNSAGLVGITASFFSIMYGFSRQIFSMSRDGYLPYFLSRTNKKGAPWLAILVPGFISFVISIVGGVDQIVIVLVLCATLSYIMMLASHITLRINEKGLHRPYKTPFGIWTSGLGIILALVAFLSSLAGDIKWVGITLGLLFIGCIYYWLFSVKNLKLKD